MDREVWNPQQFLESFREMISQIGTPEAIHSDLVDS